MQILWAKQALMPEGWKYNVRIDVDASGRIAAATPDSEPIGQRLDMVLPAPGNLHSHAFQRAMAGLTEHKGAHTQDSFWTWRNLMYRFLDVLTPDDVSSIAAYVQMEMLCAGFASVGEFHYLHHAPGGTRYDNPAEMSERICAAQKISGIGLTHLPVLYAQGGCDGRALVGGQLRFGHDLDGFARLVDAATHAVGQLSPDCTIGIAPHSLRAVPRDMLDHLPDIAGDGPIHIHIAEQQAEIIEVTASLGARPVEWLLNIFHVDSRWCLIHATHLTPAETIGLASSGAVAGLCPITESNLGDGIFDGVRYLENGGRFGIGSDSNIRISLTGEVRTLEYSQRLRDHSRAALARADQSTGRVIFENIATGGAQALGRDAGVIAPGKLADLVEIETSHPDLMGLSDDMVLDAWLFARDDTAIRNVWSAGRHLVQNGAHIRAGDITASYRKTVLRLRGAM